MIHGRVEKAEKTYRTIYLYLKCPSIPLAARVTVFKAVVVWGMHMNRCSGIQVLLNKALRVMMGTSEKDMTIKL